jgi:hypothetical protein
MDKEIIELQNKINCKTMVINRFLEHTGYYDMIDYIMHGAKRKEEYIIRTAQQRDALLKQLKVLLVQRQNALIFEVLTTTNEKYITSAI